MKVIIVLMCISFSIFSSECDQGFELRGESLETLDKTINCFEALKVTDKLKEASRLNKLSYLHFFKATYFEENAIKNLKASYNYASKGVQLFSKMFNYSEVSSLTDLELESLALSYYFYGTAVSKYVDLKGKFEAIKRMNDIKNSMKAILRLRKKETFYYGAYRTLAIFYFKVPAIAGGSYEKSQSFFNKLMKSSDLGNGISSYPVNHVFYSDFLFRYKGKKESCDELRKVLDISEQQLESTYKKIYYETKKDLQLAQKKFKKRAC